MFRDDFIGIDNRIIRRRICHRVCCICYGIRCVRHHIRSIAIGLDGKFEGIYLLVYRKSFALDQCTNDLASFVNVRIVESTTQWHRGARVSLFRERTNSGGAINVGLAFWHHLRHGVDRHCVRGATITVCHGPVRHRVRRIRHR